MNKSDSIVKLAAAMAKVQSEMPAAQMNATNPFLKNRYADLGSVIATAKPVLAKYGISVAQFPVGDGATVGVETVLMHESGEWMSNTLTLEAHDEKGKSGAQVAGSIISYLRRYALASVLGMYADEDTDGNGKQTPAKSQPATSGNDEVILHYEDGSSVTLGNSPKAKSEQASYAEYVKVHDGKVPANIFNLRKWKENQSKES